MTNQQQLQKTLQLLVHHAAPAYDRAWMAGYDAAQADKKETENPFSQQDEEHDAWKEGWWSGFYNEAPLYDSAVCLDTQTALLQAAANAASLDDQSGATRISKSFDRVLYGLGIAVMAAVCYDFALEAAV